MASYIKCYLCWWRNYNWSSWNDGDWRNKCLLNVDEITRLGLNTANLVDPSAIGASSLGGLIGRCLGRQDGQRLGELINDGITAGVGGGALASGIEAGEALNQGQHAKAFYFVIDGGNSAINAYNTSQTGNH